MIFALARCALDTLAPVHKVIADFTKAIRRNHLLQCLAPRTRHDLSSFLCLEIFQVPGSAKEITGFKSFQTSNEMAQVSEGTVFYRVTAPIKAGCVPCQEKMGPWVESKEVIFICQRQTDKHVLNPTQGYSAHRRL